MQFFYMVTSSFNSQISRTQDSYLFGFSEQYLYQSLSWSSEITNYHTGYFTIRLFLRYSNTCIVKLTRFPEGSVGINYMVELSDYEFTYGFRLSRLV